MAAKREINGKTYRVVESLGMQAGGRRACVVRDEAGEEHMAVKEDGVWRLWTVEDRLGGRRS